jgi:transcriptional regulator with XRE-family HTH domain
MDNHMLDCVMGTRKIEQTMLGNWLRTCRGERSQTEVAARIGMDQAEWSRWERGERKRPNPDQIRAFAEALRVPVASVALAYAGIWPGDASALEPVNPPDDLIALARQIATLSVRLTQLAAGQRDHVSPSQTTAEGS